MFESVKIIGAPGRVGSAVSGRLAERGVRLDDASPALVLLCVPDRAIPAVAAAIEPCPDDDGPWVAHVSGATSLEALSPHVRRFSVHPLQTFTHRRGPEQLDGAWAAVTGESEDALAAATSLAETLGLRPFVLSDANRALYHAGAAIASNFLVTLRRAAGGLLETAGVPPEALDPLMRRTIENDFELTGAIERGDWDTVSRHVAAIVDAHPQLEASYRELASLTALQIGAELPAEALA
jgi:predicted short-subunit dehydrogenase-like oxidoreductase (DUF2520 family)